MSGVHVQLVNKPTSPRTGIGRYAVELERGLREHGVDFRIAPLRRPVPQAAISLGSRAGYDLDAFFRSYPLRASVLPGYVTHLTSQTLGVLLLTQRLPRPVVVTVHDILPYLLRHDPKCCVYRRVSDRLMDGLAMRGLKFADRLIADSHYTKDTMVDALRIDGDRIDVVHLGVDGERFRRRHIPRSFRERYQLPAGYRYVLYVGSEDPRKGVPDLLRAFAAVHSGFRDAILVKVGAPAFGDQRNRHLRLCEELGIAGVVRWFDSVPEPDLSLFYNAADVVAFPSRYEGFGFPVLEALACGTPVVAVRASSIPELAGDAAILLDNPTPEFIAGALIRILVGSRPDRERLVNQAKRFSWNETVRATRQIYTDVASQTAFGTRTADGDVTGAGERNVRQSA